jgi:hypothetical protein
MNFRPKYNSDGTADSVAKELWALSREALAARSRDAHKLNAARRLVDENPTHKVANTHTYTHT